MAVEQLVTNNQSFGELLRDRMGCGSCKVLSVDLGQGCADLAGDGAFQLAAQELVDNCAEKKAEDIEIGMRVEFDEPTDTFRMVVEDNIRYSPEELTVIMKNLKRKYSQRSSKAEKRVSEGGIGKSMVRGILERWGGSLTHEVSEDGRIIAVARWQRQYFLHPLPQQKPAGYIRYV